MALVFRSLHRASKPELLNEEWLVLENTGPGPLNAAGWTLAVGAKGQRAHPLGTLQPGFVIRPGEKVRLVTGSPSKKAQGTPPAEEAGLKSYHLFLREPVLQRAGQLLYVQLHQLELARTVFDPEAPDGIAVAS
jgi:hypothetical protein